MRSASDLVGNEFHRPAKLLIEVDIATPVFSDARIANTVPHKMSGRNLRIANRLWLCVFGSPLPIPVRAKEYSALACQRGREQFGGVRHRQDGESGGLSSRLGFGPDPIAATGNSDEKSLMAPVHSELLQARS